MASLIVALITPPIAPPYLAAITAASVLPALPTTSPFHAVVTNLNFTSCYLCCNPTRYGTKVHIYWTSIKKTRYIILYVIRKILIE